ncbi:MAG: EAL domain-containing protein [Campylobacterota bacterium]
MLDAKWKHVVKNIEISFEPIISCNTAKTYGVNVGFGNIQNCGRYFSIHNLFDDAFDDGVLYQLDIELRKLAFLKYQNLKQSSLKIFYPLDNRLMYMSDYRSGNTDKILEKLQLSKKNLYYEISDRDSLKDPMSIKNTISTYKNEGFNILLSDFGVGMSSLQLLYFSNPRIIKLDNFCTRDIVTSIKKRHFLKSITELAHSMQAQVIAKNIQTKQEYYILKEMGVDYIQGGIAQEESLADKAIKKEYKFIAQCNSEDKRVEENDTLKDSFIQTDIQALEENASMYELFTYFQQNPHSSFVPIVDTHKMLIGVIYETDIKKISYSQYGLALAKNNSFGAKLSSYIKPAAWVEQSWGVDKTLEIYNRYDDNKGIFVTKDSVYYGFITVKSLLELSYKRNLQIAQNQNPLSKLPGNSMIEQYLHGCSKTEKIYHHIVYFDFNDFKPFNDTYGFRQGDRAILIFTDILKKKLPNDSFIAHIGGDDFFVGFDNFVYEEVFVLIQKVCDEFAKQVSSLYKSKDRENGYIKVKDRFGIKREFGLLSVSAAIVEIYKALDMNLLDSSISKLKKASKKSPIPLGISLHSSLGDINSP